MHKFKFKYLLYLGLVLSTMLACRSNDVNKQLLEQAQALAENKPKEALLLLDSISKPELMEKDLYMQYIVARTQLNFLTGQSVAKDTLLPLAVDYFKANDNKEQLALAYFYGGNVFYKQQKVDKALEYYLHTVILASELNDMMLKARSLYNIGNVYYANQMYDSTIVYQEKALPIFQQLEDRSKELITLSTLSKNYISVNQFDKAKEYAQKTSDLAEKLGNERLSLIAIQHLAIIDRYQGKYHDASDKYHTVLKKSKVEGDLIRTNLSLARLHREMNNTDSINYYNNVIKDYLTAVKDPFMLQELYSTLSLNYKVDGDVKRSAFYAEQALKAQEILDAQNESARLAEINKSFVLAVYKDQSPKKGSVVVYLVSFLMFIILSIAMAEIVNIVRRKKMDNQLKKIQLQSRRK